MGRSQAARGSSSRGLAVGDPAIARTSRLSTCRGPGGRRTGASFPSVSRWRLLLVDLREKPEGREQAERVSGHPEGEERRVALESGFRGGLR